MKNGSNVLEKIIESKRELVEKGKRRLPAPGKVAHERKTLSLKAILDNRPFSVIAEVKRSSPSAGNIRDNLDPGRTAIEYEANGAAGISVLTCEPFFNGSMQDLEDVRRSVNIPILMKDFIIDPWQVSEGRRYGADIVLLILGILDDGSFRRLSDHARNIGLEVLVEVHTPGEIERALRLVDRWEGKILGINNRNLRTLETDTGTTPRLMKLLQGHEMSVISESGIRSRQDVLDAVRAGVRGVLVGESLLREGRPGENLKLICGR